MTFKKVKNRVRIVFKTESGIDKMNLIIFAAVATQSYIGRTMPVWGEKKEGEEVELKHRIWEAYVPVKNVALFVKLAQIQLIPPQKPALKNRIAGLFDSFFRGFWGQI